MDSRIDGRTLREQMRFKKKKEIRMKFWDKMKTFDANESKLYNKSEKRPKH